MQGTKAFPSVVVSMALFSIVWLAFSEVKAEDPPFVGVNIGGDYLSPEWRQAEYDHLYLFDEAGIEIFGQSLVSWHVVEPAAPTQGVHDYNWSALDADIQAIEAAGGICHADLACDASWAVEVTGALSSPPKDDVLCAAVNPGMGMNCWDAWRAFVGAVVERYDHDGVDDMPGLQYAHLYWQIGTECENIDQWNTGDGTQRVEKYVALLRAASEAAKQANPDVKIISFSFNFGDGFDNNPSVEAFNQIDHPLVPERREFTVQVWEQGKDYFDMVGTNIDFHYNGIPARVRWIRSYLDKPIWIDEAVVAHLLDRHYLQPLLYDESVYPYKTETEIGQILVEGGHPEHDTIKRWWEQEKAKYAVKKAVIAASQGVANISFICIFDTMGINEYWGSIAEMALNIGGGILEYGYDSEPIGTPKPVYYTLELFDEKTGGFDSVTDLNPLPQGADPTDWVWEVRFARDNKDIFVLWSEGQERTVDLTSYLSTPRVKITHIVKDLGENNEPLYQAPEMAWADSIPVDETPVFAQEFPSMPFDSIAALNRMTDGRERLLIFEPPVNGDTCPLAAIDGSFGNATNDYNLVAIAGVDIDGNGIDEIAALNNMVSGRQRLVIFNAPMNGDTGPPIASDSSFGNATNDYNLVAIAGVDIDGNGIDEIAALNNMVSGRQRLVIFNAPVGGDTGPPIASDSSFGNATNDYNLVAIAGVDIDGNGIDEVAALNNMVSGRQRLVIFNAPVGGDTGPPVGGDGYFGNWTNDYNLVAIAGVDVDGDGLGEIAALNNIIISWSWQHTQRLVLFDSSVSGDSWYPIACDASFGYSADNRNIIAIAGIQ